MPFTNAITVVCCPKTYLRYKYVDVDRYIYSIYHINKNTPSIGILEQF